ncbi:MAG: hypothetical protein IKV72_01095, partial [Firmicutes bacterium]|nr:hypothetical protein [Bacillota bacterium]
MDNRNNGYGPLLLLLGQLMSGARQNPPVQAAADAETLQMTEGEFRGRADAENGYFAQDETECTWRREERVEMLADFCREGYAMA